MAPQIDWKSVASHHLALYAYSQPVGTGTGFVVCVDNIDLLLTNYHVVSGRHPQTGKQLPDVTTIPDRILIPVLRRLETGGARAAEVELLWRPLVQRLDVAGEPTWAEHPRFGRQFDVVALPIQVPSDAQVVPYPRDPGPEIALPPSSDVAIIGFPEGMSASGITALWKTGAVASEPDLLVGGEEFFWIDANTRRGMSGSPVIARRFGAAMMADGGYGLTATTVDRLLGVYAGRALDAPDMTLGRVWKWQGVQEVIEAAIAKCRRGTLRPHLCRVGYYSQSGKNMVKLDVQQSVDVPIQQPNGTVVKAPFTLAQFISGTVLNDARFGANLERVKMAVAIEAAVDAAQTGGTLLELDDAQYALVREATEQPAAGYNASIARQLLPLMEHIVNAGQGSTGPAQQP